MVAAALRGMKGGVCLWWWWGDGSQTLARRACNSPAEDSSQPGRGGPVLAPGGRAPPRPPVLRNQVRRSSVPCPGVCPTERGCSRFGRGRETGRRRWPRRPQSSRPRRGRSCKREPPPSFDGGPRGARWPSRLENGSPARSAVAQRSVPNSITKELLSCISRTNTPREPLEPGWVLPSHRCRPLGLLSPPTLWIPAGFQG